MEVPRPRIGSKPQPQPVSVTAATQSHQILNPLCQARDQTCATAETLGLQPSVPQWELLKGFKFESNRIRFIFLERSL